MVPSLPQVVASREKKSTPAKERGLGVGERETQAGRWVFLQPVISGNPGFRALASLEALSPHLSLSDVCLFVSSTFGELKTVRLPKKMTGTGAHRGFGFVDFVTKQDAKVSATPQRSTEPGS